MSVSGKVLPVPVTVKSTVTTRIQFISTEMTDIITLALTVSEIALLGYQSNGIEQSLGITTGGQAGRNSAFQQPAEYARKIGAGWAKLVASHAG